MEYSLKFLYSRIKDGKLSEEEIQSKVCQEILVSKIASDSFLNQKVSFKGGLIIDAISQGKRGYTKDIDFDLIKYPLSNDGLSHFFSRLNSVTVYNNIEISVLETKELRHKNYQGKRVVLCFKDKESKYRLTVDIGIYSPLIKRNNKFEYNIAFGGTRKININPVERMIAEKISTFAIYLTDNTRIKDLYDAYYLISNINHDKEVTMEMLQIILVKRNHFYKTFDLAKKAVAQTLTNKDYVFLIEKEKRNWTGVDTSTLIKVIIDYLK